MKLYTLFLFSLLCGQGMLLSSYNKYKLKNLNLSGRDSTINPVDKIQCTTTTFSQPTHCNDNFKVNQCHGVEVKLSCGDVSTEFSKVLSNIDHSAHNNESLRQMQITLHNCTHSDFERVSLLTDTFCTPRLWWQVVHETFHAPQSIEITLNRYHPMYEPHLRLLGSIHYPANSASCNKSVMLVNRNTCVHPGWGSVLEQFYDASKQLPYAVIGMHVSSSNRRDDNTSFISSADCMERVDKWGCAFLPTTNCNVPLAMGACHTHNCVQHIPESVHFSLLFNHAAADGVLIQRHHAAYKSAVRGAQSPVDGEQLSLSAHLTPPPFTYALPYALAHSTYDSYDVESNDKNSLAEQLSYILRWSPVYHMESAMTLFHFRYLLRTNHFYRTRVQQSMANFHAVNNITPSTRCVAAQVRRGDRVIYGVNMTEFCVNATAPLTASHPVNLCLNKHQQLGPNGKVLADQARQDHHHLKESLTKMEHMTKGPRADFDKEFDTLFSDLQHHIQAEERDDLQLVVDNVSIEDRAELGKKFLNRKSIAPTRPHSSVPEKPVMLEEAMGLVSAPLDKFRDLFRDFPKGEQKE